MYGERLITAALAVRRGPTKQELAKAPYLDRYRFGMNFTDQLVLTGSVSGHPSLPDEDIFTSALIMIDLDRHIARTRSRWYRLGRPEQSLASDDGGPSLPVVQAYLGAQLQMLLAFAR